ncbi:MAG TPA: hypothetical protein VFD43_03150 [Planctomycetota bacterium]|nr:hypothetical protein [Planctomycetota bacterium]
MALRLSHVLVLMALVLAAGVLSVQGLEPGNAVQGTLLIVVPGLTPLVAAELQRVRGDVRWATLPAGDGVFAPFDEARVDERAAHGSVVALFVQPPRDGLSPEDRRGAWRVLVAPESGDVLPSVDAFVRAQTGTRPFLAGLVLPASPGAAALPALLEPLLRAAESLPSFRRTSIVLLGERAAGSGSRAVARVERGRGAQAGPVTLAGLLERDS